MLDNQTIHPDVRIGHVHLKVADLERALAFYCGVLGFQLTQRYGRGAAFISAGGLSSPYRPEYVGESRRVAAAATRHWTLSSRDSLSIARGVG